MFVKWKHRDHHKWPCTVDAAYLVRSVRTPNGPRHEHICYIGSITNADDNHWTGGRGDMVAEIIEIYAGQEGYRHRRFWKVAMANLKKAGIEDDELAKIVARLEERVPRPKD
jgi:hypothetical protein